jgi:hypothetical protein
MTESDVEETPSAASEIIVNKNKRHRKEKRK